MSHAGSFGLVLLSIHNLALPSRCLTLLGFPFQLRLSLHSSGRSLLRSFLQKYHPCYLLPGLCDFLNIAVSLIIYSCRLQAWKSRLWVPPSDASPRYSLVPGPHVQWPLCIFDNLGGHFLWWPFPSRMPWRSYPSGIIIQMDWKYYFLEFSMGRVSFQPLFYQPVWVCDCSVVVLFPETLTGVCLYPSWSQLWALCAPFSPKSSFFLSGCSVCSA